MAQKFAEENLPEGVSELQLTQLPKAEDGKKDLAVEGIDEISLEIEDPNAADNAGFVDVSEDELLEACEASLKAIQTFVERFARGGRFDSVELSGGGLRMRQVRDCVAAGLRAAGVSEISVEKRGEVLDASRCAER